MILLPPSATGNRRDQVTKFRTPAFQNEVRCFNEFHFDGVAPPACEPAAKSLPINARFRDNPEYRMIFTNFDLEFLHPTDAVQNILDVMGRQTTARYFDDIVDAPDHLTDR